MRLKKISLGLILFCVWGAIHAQNKIEFEAYDIYPEGVAYDAATKAFYVSGVRHATIGKVTMTGVYTALFQDTTLRSTYGMKLDPSGKKLWVCAGDANYSKYASTATHKKMIRLIAIDPATGKKLNDIDLTNITEGKHFANDLIFDTQGNIYVTDSYSPSIYKVDASGNATLFVTSPWFWSANIGLNGIVYHPAGYLLTVNSGAGAIFKVSLSDPKNITKVKIDQFFPGGDGIVLETNNTIALVQNQSVNKVFKLVSNDNWQTAKVTMATKPQALLAQPSTIAMAGKNIWVLNSKLNELADSMHVPSKKFSIQLAQFVSVQ